MTSGQVQQLIDAIKSASPAIWHAAQNQVRAEIVQDWTWVAIFGILAVFALFVAVAGWVVTLRIDDPLDNFGWAIAAIFASVLFVVALILVGVHINDLIQKIQAPDYAAIQNLTSLLPGS